MEPILIAKIIVGIYLFIVGSFGFKYAEGEWKWLWVDGKKVTWKDYLFSPVTFVSLVVMYVVFWPVILTVEYKERRKRRGR